MTAAITRKDISARELRTAAAKTADAKAARRLLAAANAWGSGSQMQCRRAAKAVRPPLGPAHAAAEPGAEGGLRADAAQKPRFCDRRGMRWQRADLQCRIGERFGVTVPKRTAGRPQAAPGFCRLSLHPQHPSSDPAAQDVFWKTSPQPCWKSGSGSSPWCRHGSEAHGGRPDRPTRCTDPHPGPAWQPPHFGLYPRCRLRRARGHCRTGHAECRHAGDDRAPGRIRPHRCQGRARHHRPRRHRPTPLPSLAATRYHPPFATAALYPGPEPHRECPGLPAGQPPGHPGFRNL
jgi:hypothetical protein